MARDRDPFTKADGQDPAAAPPATTASPVLSTAPTARQARTGGALDATTALPQPGTAAQPSPQAGPAAEAPDGTEKRGIAAWLTMPWLTLPLAVGIVAALGFIAGVLVERHQLP
ncbi:hypothetical protein [Streptomyces sp. NPDC048361]|uniref:hypothetical protein n=1 Tax=Streptomyces sp. NPDC048361 TaxID=3154720 RepID=UPI00341574C6